MKSSVETHDPAPPKLSSAPSAEHAAPGRIGAEVAEEGVRYCVWSPAAERVEVEIVHGPGGAERLVPMERDAQGYFIGLDPEGKAGDAYKYRVNGGTSFPDPASRAQADSVHGRSLVIDPRAYRWTDAEWRRPSFRDVVIYELHVGTFTSEGTFRAVIDRLPHLRTLGINAIEIMPVADFPGTRNWGYDGVLIYAPARAYGRPDDLRALVDAAHQHGLAVILDVVYNHFGPDGNYLSSLSPMFFNPEHHTPWGAAINFDGESSAPVRDFFVQNPIYWMEQFHIDGFRLDATHAIIDQSECHIFADITAAIHARGGYAIAEDSRNDAQLLNARDQFGYNFDAVWADDFHHVVRVGQTGQREAYFQDFKGTLDELIETLRYGWLYRGQYSRAAEEHRGTECEHLPPSKFVHCISNHDQTGNRAFGERLSDSISSEAYRAISTLLCLTPYTPMLFMGQEWAASTPFLFFTDHNEQLGPVITEGRRREFAEFPEFTDRQALKRIPDPQSQETFLNSKLDWDEVPTGEHVQVLALYSECFRLRRGAPEFRPQSRDTWDVERLVFDVGALRFGYEGTKYLVLFDLAGGHSGRLRGESIARLPQGEHWELLLSSNAAHFGGSGAQLFDANAQHCDFREPATIVLRSESRDAELIPGNKQSTEPEFGGGSSKLAF